MSVFKFSETKQIKKKNIKKLSVRGYFLKWNLRECRGAFK